MVALHKDGRFFNPCYRSSLRSPYVDFRDLEFRWIPVRDAPLFHLFIVTEDLGMLLGERNVFIDHERPGLGPPFVIVLTKPFYHFRMLVDYVVGFVRVVGEVIEFVVVDKTPTLSADSALAVLRLVRIGVPFPPIAWSAFLAPTPHMDEQPAIRPIRLGIYEQRQKRTTVNLLYVFRDVSVRQLTEGLEQI